MQAYLPYLGWGLFSVVTVILAYREHRASGVGQSLQTAMQDLNVMKTSQSQLQVCCLAMPSNLRYCLLLCHIQPAGDSCCSIGQVAVCELWLLRDLLPGID